MSESKRIELSSPEGLYPRLALFYAQLEDVRNSLKNYANDWTREQLEQEPVPGFFSPAALLAHCAETEAWWIQMVIEGKCVMGGPQRLSRGWCKPFEEEEGGEPVAKGQPLKTYLFLLDRMRRHTCEVLKGMGAEDLDRSFPFTDQDGQDFSFSLEWVLHHLVEHEAHHRGQFALLKRLLSP